MKTIKAGNKTATIEHESECWLVNFYDEDDYWLDYETTDSGESAIKLATEYLYG